jgi:hypothetical protein
MNGGGKLTIVSRAGLILFLLLHRAAVPFGSSSDVLRGAKLLFAA